MSTIKAGKFTFKNCTFQPHGSIHTATTIHAFNLHREYETYQFVEDILEHRYYCIKDAWFYKGTFTSWPLKDDEPEVQQFKAAMLLMGITS